MCVCHSLYIKFQDNLEESVLLCACEDWIWHSELTRAETCCHLAVFIFPVQARGPRVRKGRLPCSLVDFVISRFPMLFFHSWMAAPWSLFIPDVQNSVQYLLQDAFLQAENGSLGVSSTLHFRLTALVYWRVQLVTDKHLDSSLLW